MSFVFRPFSIIFFNSYLFFAESIKTKSQTYTIFYSYVRFSAESIKTKIELCIQTFVFFFLIRTCFLLNRLRRKVRPILFFIHTCSFQLNRLRRILSFVFRPFAIFFLFRRTCFLLNRLRRKVRPILKFSWID